MRSAQLWPFRGLAGRIVTILFLALLPVGAMAFLQATQIATDAARRADVALLTETAEAAAGEAISIASASGTVAALVAQAEIALIRGRVGLRPSEECSDTFESVVTSNPQYSFAGFVDTSGTVVCGSRDVGADLSTGLVHPLMSANPAPTVLATADGQISHTSIIVTAAPVWLDGEYKGFAVVSVPHARIRDILSPQPEDTLDHIITFNALGDIISSNTGLSDARLGLPASYTLDMLANRTQATFQDRTEGGELRQFAVVPIIPGTLYALGSAKRASQTLPFLYPMLFPALMIIAGLVAAYLSVNSLVIRHIRTLTRHMTAYGRDRTINSLPQQAMMPEEFKQIDAVWTELAQTVLRDEADLENLVHEKNVLLKEVHHRVKNNLQLIASIVNLKIRRATSGEARRALREVQMRVMSIASVHQALYTTTQTGKVPANELLVQVIDATIDAGISDQRAIEITRRYDPVLLYPDQAVPFLLVVSEAVTNALKYMGQLDDGTATLTITLTAMEDGQAEMLIENTKGTPFFPPDQVNGSGLGQSLIRGFANQLGAQLKLEEADDHYTVQLRFTPAPFDESEGDLDPAQFEQPAEGA